MALDIQVPKQNAEIPKQDTEEPKENPEIPKQKTEALSENTEVPKLDTQVPKLDTPAEENCEESTPSLTISTLSAHLKRATITVPESIVKRLYNQTINHYQQWLFLPGFNSAKTPQRYISKHYQEEIESHVKGFLYSHIALPVLDREIHKRKLLNVNVPRLISMDITPTGEVFFSFDLSIVKPINLKTWKHFTFKMPRRKNYKDLDKQVANFMMREQAAAKKRSRHAVQETDWVGFSAQLVDQNGIPVSLPSNKILWIKIITDTVTHSLSSLFLGKKVGNTFLSDKLELEKSFSSERYGRYPFLITVKSLMKGSYLSFEFFKASYKLRNKLDIHKKLIEVFSYRNDLSQRKAIIEELFHLFFSKHRFQVPKHIVLRKQEDIILSLKQHPDYHVYKTDKEFIRQVERLAEKQLREEILIDQIAYDEGVSVDEKDINCYLHLFNNERLKEFVYFKPAHEDMENASFPLHPSVIRQAALREKTLNHIIHILSR